MAQPIDHARGLYVKLHQYQDSLDDRDKENISSEIKKFITISIKEIFNSEALYKHPILLNMLREALSKQSSDNDGLMTIVRAFEGLEKYFLLLVEQPWKPEFKKIKTYGGFYRTKIKSVLPECDKVFQLAGYKYFTDTSLLLYEGPINKTRLLLLAFDCKVSVTICNTIAKHYNKGKGAGISHADAVSSFISKASTDYSNVPFRELNENIKQLELNPPAIPKREPLINGSNTKKPNVKHESEMIFDDIVLFPPALPQRSSFPMSSNSLSHFNIPPNIPPLLSENIIPEAYVDEVLPDLQQGTCDEHILESWKALEQQQRNPKFSAGYIAPSYVGNQTNLDEFKWMQPNLYQRPSASVRGMTSASGLTPHPLVHRSRQGSMQGSIDEGIDCRSFYAASAKFSSSMHAPNPSPHSQRLNSGYSPSFVDPGYKTGPPSDNAYTQGSSYMMNQPTIYHAPNILTDGQSPYNMRQASGPPPIPSRTLKPSYSSKLIPEDLNDSSNFNKLMAQSRGQSQSEIIMSPTCKGNVMNPTLTPPAKHVQLRDKALVSKANSLKYNGEKDSLHHQHLVNVRLAHSMDLTPLQHWECKSCTAKNVHGDNVCSVCSCSKIGPDLSQQSECGKTCKACGKCTFENNPSRTSCEVCGEKLQDRFTYV